MRVSVVGTGYVGLVSGACLAERGHIVTCVDVDQRKVDQINQGISPIHEQGLDLLLKRHVGARLRASTDLSEAVASSQITLIAVGTPTVSGQIDLQYVVKAARDVGAALKQKASRHTIVMKSTVIPGTTDGLVLQTVQEASGLKVGQDFGLGMNPEFLTEGQAVKDFLEPDRIVVGACDQRTHEILLELYADFADTPKILCNTRTAEMIKYASNALLASMISFSNEIGRLCARLGGVDVVDVMRGVHASSYLTTRSQDGSETTAGISRFLEAGCGFGGSCLPKDVAALVALGQTAGVELPLLRSVLEVNAGQPDEMMRLVRKRFASLSGTRVTVLGLAFKPDTDDTRESPAFPLIARLREAGAEVTAYDPVARPKGHAELSGVKLAATLDEALTTAEVIFIVTRWPEFSLLHGRMNKLGRSALVIDGRRIVMPDSVAAYEGIGR